MDETALINDMLDIGSNMCVNFLVLATVSNTCHVTNI